MASGFLAFAFCIVLGPSRSGSEPILLLAGESGEGGRFRVNGGEERVSVSFLVGSYCDWFKLTDGLFGVRSSVNGNSGSDFNGSSSGL